MLRWKKTFDWMIQEVLFGAVVTLNCAFEVILSDASGVTLKFDLVLRWSQVLLQCSDLEMLRFDFVVTLNFVLQVIWPFDLACQHFAEEH